MTETVNKSTIHIVSKHNLDSFELNQACEIVCTNMQRLGFEISPKDKTSWKENITKSLQDKNFYFYLIYFDGKICGFAELAISNGKLYVAEIELSDTVKHSRILLRILQYLSTAPEFLDFQEVYFNINNNNKQSIQTFMHLGGVVTEKRERSSLYRLTREQMQNYLKKFNK